MGRAEPEERDGFSSFQLQKCEMSLEKLLPLLCTLSEPQCIPSDPHYTQSDPHCTLSDPHCTLSDPHCTLSDPHCTQSDPHCTCQIPTAPNQIPTAPCQIPTAPCQIPTAPCQIPTAPFPPSQPSIELDSEEPWVEGNEYTVTCIAPDGKPEAAITFFRVPPQVPVIEGLRSENVKAGDSLRLVCMSYGGNPLATLHWTKNGEVLSTTWEVDTASQSASSALNMEVKPEDNEATLRCESVNAVSRSPLSVTRALSVLFEPSEVVLRGSSEAIEGKEVSLCCYTTSSNPAVQIRWWLGFQELNTNISIISKNAQPPGSEASSPDWAHLLVVQMADLDQQKQKIGEVHSMVQSWLKDYVNVSFVIRLTGKACTWGAALVIWKLRAMFNHLHQGWLCGQALLRLRQGLRPAADYTIEFWTLAARWNEPTLFDTFLGELRAELQAELACKQETASLNEVVHLAITYSHLLQERHQYLSHGSPQREGTLGAGQTDPPEEPMYSTIPTTTLYSGHPLAAKDASPTR
ncbi:hypothetical protein P4O66_003228 [Electrophorus voltai]|uniref:Ig-like domain-containing protein n=1 Tax=Electrophorus voltai TaxID=2609070 RepID=A0AAD8YUA5_9TELE|nr:hypothetical protein P4O66_003228 [Electrophorus voltai]